MRSELAYLYYLQGRLDEAEVIVREALQICADGHGLDHPEMASIQSGLARVLQRSGRLVESESLLRTAHAIRLKSLGEKHFFTLVALGALARNHVIRGKYAEAEPLLRESLAGASTALPEDHWFVFSTRCILCACLCGQDEYDEAEKILLRERDSGKEVGYGIKLGRRLAVELAVQVCQDRGRDDVAERLTSHMPHQDVANPFDRDAQDADAAHSGR